MSILNTQITAFTIIHSYKKKSFGNIEQQQKHLSNDVKLWVFEGGFIVFSNSLMACLPQQ